MACNTAYRRATASETISQRHSTAGQHVDDNIAVVRGVANPAPKPGDLCPGMHQLQIGIPKMFQDLRCSGGMFFSL